MINRIIIAVLAVALCAASGWAFWLARGIGSLEAENVRLRLDLGGCEARQRNIIEDQESDATVFDPDWTVPDTWLLP